MTLFRTEGDRTGMLVTVDGPNGSGKTSLCEALTESLRGEGVPVYSTSQPSPTPLGDYVRSAEPSIRGRALACLVAADRHQQCEIEIARRLADGATVICDRYVESSLVLQRLDGVDREFVVAINVGIPRPDLRIRLTAAEAVLSDRLASRQVDSDRRIERRGGPSLELSLYEEADRYLASTHDLPATVYDTSQTEVRGLARRAAELVLDKRGECKTS